MKKIILFYLILQVTSKLFQSRKIDIVKNALNWLKLNQDATGVESVLKYNQIY